MTIARDVSEPRLVELPRPPARHVGAEHRDGAAGGLPQSGDRLDQLVLAIAGDAGDAERLACPNLEIDAAEDFAPAVVLGSEPGHRQHDVGRVRLATIGRELDVPADHELSQVLLVRRAWDPLADDLAAPDDRDPIGDLEDLVQLVADEDDRMPLRSKPAQDSEDLLRLLGGEDGGGLVEDEDAGIAVERLEDLDPLLLTDGQSVDPGVGIEVEAELLAERLDLATGRLLVDEDRIRHRLLAEDDVLGDGQHRDEHEVLVDHADPASDGVSGTEDVDGLAVDEDRPCVRHGEPIQDVHQGGLAGPVLTEQGVDLARTQVEIDRVVGEDAWIPLGDPAHLKHGGDLGHCCPSGHCCIRPESENGPTQCRPVLRS